MHVMFTKIDNAEYVAAADYSMEEKMITLSRKFRNWDPSIESNAYEIDKNRSFFTLAHEMGHHVHEHIVTEAVKNEIWKAAKKDGFVVLELLDKVKEHRKTA
jgi:hypothetical protein